MSEDKKVGTAKLLFASAKYMGLNPSWLTENGLFAINTKAGERYINFARSPLNSDIGASLAKNKYMTRVILGRHGLPNIPFASPQTLPQAKEFLSRHKKIIVKPIRGLGAQDIHIIDHVDQLDGFNVKLYIFEKYISGREMRYLVLDGAVIAVHESEYGVSVEETRPLKRISYPQPTWNSSLSSLSIQISDILGLQFAAVDFLVDEDENAHILEVNTMPGLKWFHAPTSGPPVDVAQLFLKSLITELNTKATSVKYA
jgi:glutathione synthase/RimK-type ligase-like ATP-grasp enzyme